MKPISFWVPATLCAVISMAALFGSVIRDSIYWRPAFYIFLPACFFLVGAIMYRMHRELGRLRHRVGRLEHRQQQDEQRQMPHVVGAHAKGVNSSRESV
jgi:hypothetical protein